jgi:hypothetical protein
LASAQRGFKTAAGSPKGARRRLFFAELILVFRLFCGSPIHTTVHAEQSAKRKPMAKARVKAYFFKDAAHSLHASAYLLRMSKIVMTVMFTVPQIPAHSARRISTKSMLVFLPPE